MRRPADLDADSRRVLELDAVLDEVAGHASTPGAAGSIRRAVPSFDAEFLEAEHEAVAQARAWIGERGRLIGGGLPDPAPALAILPLEGYACEPAQLRDLAEILLVAADLRRALGSRDAEGYPALREEARSLADLRALAQPVAENVGPDGRLLDGASAELHRVRQAIGRTGERLRRQLESFVHDPAAANVVRDAFVTQRNGRFVIPVRADSPRGVPGIVHAASSSGQTLFVEPLESVDMNNELVRLAEQELVEQDRVVRRWADRFRERAEEVLATVGGLERVDTLQARALWADAFGACRPVVAQAGHLELVEVRHPLLDRRLRERGERCVPLTLGLPEGRRVLVISGPNTGGKTVALKTVGLAILLAQCGIPVPARRAACPAGAWIRADIGDRQSIEADLSTFSGHVRSAAAWLREVRAPAWVLFDEIGTGTEPTEGAALAQALLERFAARGVACVATTHQSALKTWAFASDVAASAALEFDEEALRPTYRVLMGAAGASAGLSVAQRLGIDPEVLDRARALAGGEGRRAEDTMARLRERTADLERRLEAQSEAEADLSLRRAEVEERLEREGERMRREGARELEGVLEEFRREARRALEQITDVKVRARLEKEQARSEIRLKSTLAAKGRSLARPKSTSAPDPAKPFVPAPGAAVRILSLDREGVVRSIRDDRAEVQMGSATFTVRRADLGPPGEAAPGSAATATPRGLAASLASLRKGPSRDEGPLGMPAPPIELHLLGKTVDEALGEVDKFLDDASRAGRTEARIVHGHGTGKLKAAVRGFLKGHAHVDAFRPGEPREGGDGATVVTLR
ncbi:MAG TPA: Smr/MutS family protein [Candidatus Polarisedimenticolaceae bacterium]